MLVGHIQKIRYPKRLPNVPRCNPMQFNSKKSSFQNEGVPKSAKPAKPRRLSPRWRHCSRLAISVEDVMSETSWKHHMGEVMCWTTGLVGGWTHQPIWKIWVKIWVKTFFFPKVRGEHKKYLSCHHLVGVFMTKNRAHPDFLQSPFANLWKESRLFLPVGKSLLGCVLQFGVLKQP